MKLNLKKALLTGTAIVAVAAFAAPGTARAATSAFLVGTSGAALPPTGVQTVTVNNLNNAVWDIGDGAGSATANMTFTATSPSSILIRDTGSVNNPGLLSSITVLNDTSTSTVNLNATAGSFSFNINGNVSNSNLAHAHDVAFSLTDGGNAATLDFVGGAAQTVYATISGSAPGNGTLVAGNTAGGVTFFDAIGGGGNALATLTLTGAGGSTFSSTVNATTITTGAGNEIFTGLVTVGAGGFQAGASNSQLFSGGLTGNLNFAANGTVTLANAQTVNGNVTNTTTNNGTLDVGGAGIGHVTGTVGSTGVGLLAVNVSGAGTALLDGAVKATNINILGTGGATFGSTTAGTITLTGAGADTTTLGGNLTGNIIFGAGAVAASDVTLADLVNVTTTIDNTTGTLNGSGVGTLLINGNGAHLIGGNVGGTSSLHQITLAGAGGVVGTSFSGTVNADTILYTGAGTANFAHTVTTDAIDFGGVAGIANFADGANVVGDIIDSVGGGGLGTVNFAGASTVSLIGAELGSLGTPGNGLALVTTAGASGGAHDVTVDGTIVATNIGINGTGALTALGNVTATTINFGADGTFNVGPAVTTVAGNITNTTISQGTLSIGSTAATEFTGTVGVGGGGALKAVNLTGVGGVVTFDQNVVADTVGLNAASETLQLNGNLTTITGAGTITGSAVTDTIQISGHDSTITNSGALTGVGQINVLTVNTLTLAGAGAVTGGTINLEANGSILTVSGAKTISSAITGAAGTQTINATNNVTLSGPITLVEAVTVDAAHTLILSGGMDVGGTAGTVTMTGAGGSQVTVSTAEVNAAINGGAGGDTLAVNAGGTVDGAVVMGAGNDTLSLGGGTLGSTVDMGAGVDHMVLTASSAVSHAISNLETADLAGFTLTLSAPITGGNVAAGTGFNINGGTLAINSGGSVAGSIYGAGTLNFGANAGGGTYLLGGVVDQTALTVTSGTLSTNGFTMGTVTPLGAVNVAAAGIFNVQDNVTSGAALASNAGTINISAGKALTVTSVTGAPTGTFGFQLNRTAGFDTNGQLVINPGGGNVDFHLATITVSQKAGSQPLLGGDVFHLETGAATLSALPANPVENSLLFNYVLSNVGPGALDMTVTLNPSASSIITPGNNATVAQVLLGNLNGSTDPQIMAIQNNLAAASTAQQVNEIIESTQPTVDGSASAGSFDFSDQTFDLADDQLFALRTGNDVTGMAAGDATHGMALWGEMFGQHANQGDRDGIDGYNSNTWGGAIGVDTRNVSDRAVIGIAGSYGRTNASSDNANATDTNIDSYQATLYGNYNIARATYVDAMAAYGWNKDDTTRYNVGAVPGLTAHGSFNARQISARVGAGRDFDVDSTVLTPNVLVHWVNYNPDSYTETGAGGADLHVNGNNLNLLELGLGVKAGWSLKNADGSMFKPQLHAGYRYAAVDSRVEDTSSFTAGGGTFTTQGATPDRSRVDLGAAIKFQTTNNWDLTASYDFNWRSDYTSHAGFLRAGYKF